MGNRGKREREENEIKRAKVGKQRKWQCEKSERRNNENGNMKRVKVGNNENGNVKIVEVGKHRKWQCKKSESRKQ